MPYLLIILSVCAACLMIALYTYRICFHVTRHQKEKGGSAPTGEQYDALQEALQRSHEFMKSAQYESVSIASFDGTKLFGRYYENQKGAPLVILFHGYRSAALRDCVGGYYIAGMLKMNVLAVDHRAHGNSEGHVISFGILERKDCLAWAEYAANRFGDVPIVLSGLSMGAATVLMASELPLPKQVAGIMADCPYSSPKEIIKKVCADEKYPVNLSYPFIWLGALLFGHFNLTQADALRAVAHTRVPILLIHGEDDRFVPCSMSERIFAQKPDKITFYVFPKAGHGLSYLMDNSRYQQCVVKFLHSLPPFSDYIQRNNWGHELLNRYIST